ncbi:MAG: bifunctional [glutamine synthetase] adenylyltransferase/[glutamine synthetase]-adenylyl-L-tyrosine phosphorylase [Hyphomicrobiales bacterium]|nr:bifunctional [glutamine synthetase] adenylyltransferase/[glutamine synthetase]-adenylyl-L-tyrosine phosphorylase [Hyphomicrobiales bacterium]
MKDAGEVKPRDPNSSPEPLIERVVVAPRPRPGRRRDLAGEFIAAIEDEKLRARLAELLRARPKASQLVSAILGYSPFLSRIARTHPEWLFDALAEPPELHLARLIDEMARIGARAEDDLSIMPALRHARQRVALLVALADLGGIWELEGVTEALTRFADAAVALATDFVLRDAHRSGRLVLPDPKNPGKDSSFVLIAMGKHGARELNYSSDIDLIALHDPASANVAASTEPDALFARLTQRVVRLLQSRTDDDYVLRVDLRLRPDPSSTPPSVPLAAAYQYYETVGQNWERAAFIKARPVAGDIAMGRAFLAELSPFVWRRHLDFQAITALRGLWRDVRAVHGDDEAISGRNVKLGPGGIRECELATQALQLVFGGRDSRLRGARTLSMLKALAEAGHLPKDARKRLSESYHFLRMIEHRLQMRNDEQTQTLPREGADLEDFARWSGFASAKAFEKEFASRTSQVRLEAQKAFGDREVSRPSASVSFATKELAAKGFRRPAEASRLVASWIAPPERATARGIKVREALMAVLGELIEAFAKADDPDAAITAFDRSFERMAAPAELFSILSESETLRRLFAAMLGSAPRLAEAIVQRPHLLDVFIDVRAFSEAQTPRRVANRIAARLAAGTSHEEALDLLRDAGREEWFMAGARFLGGDSNAEHLGAAYTSVAEASLQVALDITRKAFATEHGVVPGSRLAAIAMGRLGAGEMTATSDLDLIVIYDLPVAATVSDGRRPLDPVLYFSRLTHRLITAISAPTSHGRLYDIDMRLRPSGGKGPVALPLTAFEQYQQNEAETWEHLALTRARPVAGDPALCRLVAASIRRILLRERDPARLVADVGAMRRLLASEKGDDDAADLKNMRGGLVDIDFCAQFLMLAHASRYSRLLASSIESSLTEASAQGLLAKARARTLIRARSLFTELLQRERLRSTEASPMNWNDPSILRNIARDLGAGSGAALTRKVEALRAEVKEIYDRVVIDSASLRKRANSRAAGRPG